MSLSHAVKVIPIFTSPSVSRLLDYYKTHFPEFTISPNPPDSPEPTFASIYAGPKAAVNIHIQRGAVQCARGSCMVMLDSLEVLGALYERLKIAEGIEKMDTLGWTEAPTAIVSGSGDGTRRTAIIGPVLMDTSLGYRQFDMIDPHGNLIVFFAVLEE